MESGSEVTDCLQTHSSSECCLTVTTGNHLLSELRLLHQCIFTLQPLQQHSEQIHRELKQMKQRGNKKPKYLPHAVLVRYTEHST